MNEVSQYSFWVDELAKSVTNKQRFVNRSGLLPIVTALEELSEWLNDPRQYSRMHEHAWLSVINDVEQSINNLGLLTSKRLRRRGAGLILSLRSLPLSDRALMRQSGTNLSCKQIMRRVNFIFKILNNEDVLIDAWNDLVSATRNLSSSPDELLVLRDVFIDVAYLHGKDMGDFGIRRKISEMLRSHVELLSVSEIQSLNTEINEKIAAKKDLSIEDRLFLCHEVIQYIPEIHNRVVWIEVTGASLHKEKIDCGDILLFDGEWLMGQKNINGNFDSLPSEVKKNIKRFGGHLFSGNKHTVLARINLGAGMTSNAYSEAYRLLKSLLGLGYAKQGDWIVEQGHLVYVDNREVLFSGNRSREIEQTYNIYTDSMSERIENETLTTTMVNSEKVDKRLPQLMELIKELELSYDRSPETKLLAATRLLEHVSSWCDDTQSWHKFAKIYIKQLWARNKVLTDLDKQVYPILFTGIEIQGTEFKKLQILRKKIIVKAHRTYHYSHRGKAITNLRTLSSINNIYKTSRSFDWLVAVFSNGRSLHTTLIKNESQFENEISRLVRYRNALEHGGPKHLLVSDSTTSFAVDTASLAASTTMNAFLEGKDLKNAFDRKRSVLARKYRQLSSGGKPVRILGDR